MDRNKIKTSSNKSFGLVFFTFFLIISLIPLFKGGNVRILTMVLAIIFLILGLLNSPILNPLNKIWFKFGLLLGRLISPLVMSLIFFLVVTPIALLMKLLKKDLLNLRFNKDNTYWIVKSGPKSKMKNQF